MISGIIAEYNVFHNGHKYMLSKVKRQSDAVVAVMSGSMVQRGDVAVTDKWSRAEMAVMGGVDLVLELPVCYALNAAPNFAEGGVNTLNALGIVDNIVFGSECGDIDALTRAAYSLENEDASVSDKVKTLLSEGMSYPMALSQAHSSISDELLTKPNNILGIEYIRALIRSNSKITSQTFSRTGAGHDDSNINGCYASASAIRGMLLKNEEVGDFAPLFKNGTTLRRLTRLDSAVTARLRTAKAEDIRRLNEVSEGLENRLLCAAKDSYGFTSIAAAAKSKRYTMSKIRRILLNSIIDFTKDIYSPKPEYIRVLAMNSIGMEILKKAKHSCAVPIITKTADFKSQSRMLELDLRAEDIAAICSDNLRVRLGGMDFKKSPVICELG